MLYLDSVSTVQGLTLYRDYANPKLFYYLPRSPRLAREAGDPMFQLLIYRRDITDNPAFKTGDRLGGGFLTMTVDLSVPDATIQAGQALEDPISLAQQSPDEFPTGEVGSGANLVVTTVRGPATGTHNQTIAVTYSVMNQGDAASGPYQVGLYLSANKTIDPAVDRLLDEVMFTTGLAPGKTRQKTTNVLVPNIGLSGKYYYGALVGASSKASTKQVSLVRYSLADNNETVTDHQTGLIWQQADDGVARDWANAKQYCADLILGGKADWRLPSLNELETIIDYSRDYPSIDPVFRIYAPYFAHSYWSSTTSASDPATVAWFVGFNEGDTGLYPTDEFIGYYARCVRGRP